MAKRSVRSRFSAMPPSSGERPSQPRGAAPRRGTGRRGMGRFSGKGHPGRDDKPRLRTPITDQLLIDAFADGRELSRFPGTIRVLCTSGGRGQAAVALAAHDNCHVICHTYDDFAQRAISEHVAGTRVQVVCAADFPRESFDLVLLALDHRAETELTRDTVQAGALALVPGGRLVCAVGKADDQLLHTELKRLFEKVTRLPVARGCLYLATRPPQLGKIKDYSAEFAFRDGRDNADGGRLIRVISRPGVFSHRSLDGGARALIDTAAVLPGERVIDLGCGSGAVALALAAREPQADILAIDSHARAIDCTEHGARLNALTNVRTRRTAIGEIDRPASYDLVLGNPPYFADYRIAELFVSTAQRALRPGGKAAMVTKTPGWFETRMAELFHHVATEPHGAYFVVSGVQRGASRS